MYMYMNNIHINNMMRNIQNKNTLNDYKNILDIYIYNTLYKGSFRCDVTKCGVFSVMM